MSYTFLYNYYILSLSVGSLIALIAGVVVFVNGPKRLEKISWFFLCASSAIWSLGYFFMISSQSHDIARLANLVLHQGIIFIAFFYPLFILSLTDSYKKHKLLLLTLSLSVIVFSTLNFSKDFVTDVIPKYVFNFAPEAGSLYKYFTIYFFTSIIYDFFILFRSFVTSLPEDARRFKFILLASIAGFLGGGSFFFLTFNINIPPVLVILVPIYQIIITYAILRHNLFNVRVIATELLVFSIWVFLLVRTILARSLQDALLDGGLLVLVIFFGILLIRSVLQEVRSREEISRLAEDLRIANVELKKLDQLKSEFLSLATHQLRTPLTITKGYISMIQEGTFGQVPQKIRDVLSKVYLSNERLISLVNDFLNLSRIESGRMKYNFEQMKAEQLVESAVEEFKELAKEKKVDLIWKKPSGALPEVMIDKEKFHQVLMNIIDNAFKYCKEGHIEVSMSEEAGRGSSDKNILIKVKDSGVGMTREELDSIFKKFARAQSGSKVNTEGTGLGLYLAKRIVGDHGGEIWAESEGHGLGSTFKIRLPAKGEEVSKQVQFKEFVEKI